MSANEKSQTTPTLLPPTRRGARFGLPTAGLPTAGLPTAASGATTPVEKSRQKHKSEKKGPAIKSDSAPKALPLAA